MLEHVREKKHGRRHANVFNGFSMKKGFSRNLENPMRGEYEIRTREGVNPTRFPSVRHRPLGEFSSVPLKTTLLF